MDTTDNINTSSIGTTFTGTTSVETEARSDNGFSLNDGSGKSQNNVGNITAGEAREILRTMPLSDNFMFSEVMRDPEICRRVLETILNVPIRSVNVPRTEESIKILPDSKGIRMDVHVDDDKGTVYDVEMQTGHRSELPRGCDTIRATLIWI